MPGAILRFPRSGPEQARCQCLGMTGKQSRKRPVLDQALDIWTVSVRRLTQLKSWSFNKLVRQRLLQDRLKARLSGTYIYAGVVAFVCSHCFKLGPCASRRSTQSAILSRALSRAWEVAETLCAAKNSDTWLLRSVLQKPPIDSTSSPPIQVVIWARTLGQFCCTYCQVASRVRRSLISS